MIFVKYYFLNMPIKPIVNLFVTIDSSLLWSENDKHLVSEFSLIFNFWLFGLWTSCPVISQNWKKCQIKYISRSKLWRSILQQQHPPKIDFPDWLWGNIKKGISQNWNASNWFSIDIGEGIKFNTFHKKSCLSMS